ncbi:MAG: glutaredoxin family protein [Burkholderiales bacterium]|nr:glutaredoxin family protein [Burkholderiales bacterium]
MKLLAKVMLCTVLPAALFAAQAQAQLYKWVGPDGKINYSDRPPSPELRLLEKKSLPEADDTVSLPYELANAASKNPVTLYTAESCTPCDDGRKLLKAGGIPFAEKTVKSNEDIEKLRQAGGNAQVPLLQIGGNTLNGFDSGNWKSALTNAGYPDSNKLPKEYRHPPAEPAAPAAAPAPKESGNGKLRKSPPAPKPAPAPDKGFQF